MLLAGLPFGASAAAAGPTQLARCALRDLQLLMLIEVHGEAQDVPSERLAAAYFTMITARRACAAGRIDEALAIYDSIAITPERSRRE
jgi:hypothetical protein